MASFIIADLHLSLSLPNKSMTVFGPAWHDYQSRLEKQWRNVVSADDTVILPGDLSWAITMEEALPDFEFLNALPGRKILGKGNHDFYWTSMSKMKSFCLSHHFDTISFLQNNAMVLEDPGIVLCGTRGWFIEKDYQPDRVNADFDKVLNREIIRLKLSLEEAGKLSSETGLPIVAALHFPPAFAGMKCEPILDLLEAYSVKRCYFGHIHGQYQVPQVTYEKGIELVFIAADYLHFSPYPVKNVK